MKKSKKVLAIGIPSYNGEPYLDRCIPTFIHPDIMDKIEVIIVNDGSKDKTKEIAESYQKKYPNTVVVINKENGGHGSAVNAALYYTEAKYYKVVDCDDWVDTEKLVKLVEFLEKTDAELLTNNYDTVDMETGVTTLVSNEGIEYGKVYSFDELKNKDVYFSIHSTTYKTKILKDHNIKLQEKTFFVDVEYQLLPIPYINTIVFLEDIVYKYMVGNVNQSVNMDNFVRRYDNHDRVVKRIIDFLNNNELSDSKYKYVESIFVKVLYTHYSLGCYYDSDEERGIKRAIEFDAYLKDHNMVLYNKMAKEYTNIEKLRKKSFDRKLVEKQKFERLRKIKRVIFN
jgi:glycosyltransferase involved in cell wall biosynthesis